MAEVEVEVETEIETKIEVEVKTETEVEVEDETELETGYPSQARDDRTQRKNDIEHVCHLMSITQQLHCFS